MRHQTPYLRMLHVREGKGRVRPRHSWETTQLLPRNSINHFESEKICSKCSPLRESSTDRVLTAAKNMTVSILSIDETFKISLARSLRITVFVHTLSYTCILSAFAAYIFKFQSRGNTNIAPCKENMSSSINCRSSDSSKSVRSALLPKQNAPNCVLRTIFEHNIDSPTCMHTLPLFHLCIIHIYQATVKHACTVPYRCLIKMCVSSHLRYFCHLVTNNTMQFIDKMIALQFQVGIKPQVWIQNCFISHAQY